MVLLADSSRKGMIFSYLSVRLRLPRFNRHRVSRIRRTMMGVQIIVRESESIEAALRRFNKLLDYHTVTWEMRRRRYFIKDTEHRRAKAYRKKRVARYVMFLAERDMQKWWRSSSEFDYEIYEND